MSKAPSRRLAFITVLVLALTLGLGFATLCAVLGQFAWPLDLFGHFRPQWAALGLIALLASLLLRHLPLIAVNVVLLAANVVPLVPHLMSYIREPATAEASGRAIRIASYNMRGLATDDAKFQAFVAAEKPDVIVLTEIPSDIDLRTAPLEAAYPHKLMTHRESYHEIGILSRWPIAALETNRSAGIYTPVVAADLCPPSGERGACLRLVALHGMVPFGGGAAIQSQQFDIAGRMAGSHLGPVAVIGDFNATPWSPGFNGLKRRANLIDATRGRGLTPTWQPERLSASIASLLALAIDNALVSQDIAVRASRVGPELGSDHRPIVLDLQLPELAAPRF